MYSSVVRLATFIPKTHKKKQSNTGSWPHEFPRPEDVRSRRIQYSICGRKSTDDVYFNSSPAQASSSHPPQKTRTIAHVSSVMSDWTDGKPAIFPSTSIWPTQKNVLGQSAYLAPPIAKKEILWIRLWLMLGGLHMPIGGRTRRRRRGSRKLQGFVYTWYYHKCLNCWC